MRDTRMREGEDFPVEPVAATVAEPTACHLPTLDGVCVANEGENASPLVTIMVENHFEAWPLSGLRPRASSMRHRLRAIFLRFLAPYPADAEVEKVGPVRSARPYYLDWASEYGAVLYLHVGGSPEALERLNAQSQLIDVDEFYQDWYFWRSSDRLRPHNTYTSSELWQDARADLGASAESTFERWRFADAAPCVSATTTPCAKEITATFLSPTYVATWIYATGSRQYVRQQQYREQFDENGDPIVADTVIIQRVQAVVLDEVGRKRIDTVGEGDAAVFRDGHVTAGAWRKESLTGRTRWYDADGAEIPLKAGKIWIEVVPQNGAVSWE